jgi:hemerythrin
MKEIEWFETYETGFEEIDHDHRNIFDIANGTMRALKRGDREECLRLAADFVVALETHFPREEAFLKEIGYPNVRKHAAHHKGLLRQATRFADLCGRADEDGPLPAEPFEKLVSVMLADFRGGDLEFRTFLMEKGLDKAMVEDRFGSVWL